MLTHMNRHSNSTQAPEPDFDYDLTYLKDLHFRYNGRYNKNDAQYKKVVADLEASLHAMHVIQLDSRVHGRDMVDLWYRPRFENPGRT